MPKVPAAILLASLLAAASSAPGAEKLASLPPKDAGRLNVAYTITFWTIPIGGTNFDIRITPSGYTTSSHFETSGIVSAFWQSIIDASSTGQLSSRNVSPTLYDSYYRRG